MSTPEVSWKSWQEMTNFHVCVRVRCMWTGGGNKWTAECKKAVVPPRLPAPCEETRDDNLQLRSWGECSRPSPPHTLVPASCQPRSNAPGDSPDVGPVTAPQFVAISLPVSLRHPLLSPNLPKHRSCRSCSCSSPWRADGQLAMHHIVHTDAQTSTMTRRDDSFKKSYTCGICDYNISFYMITQ